VAGGFDAEPAEQVALGRFEIGDRHVDVRVAVARPGFQQHHPRTGEFAQSTGHGAAGRAAAYDNIVGTKSSLHVRPIRIN
jgi:hypothetical protein